MFFFVVVFYFLFLFMNYVFFNSLLSKFSIGSFESGFDGVLFNQSSISVHFFLIMILFVVFDLELVVFVGFLMVDVSYYFYFFVFFFIIMGSFYLEFLLGKLIWVY